MRQRFHKPILDRSKDEAKGESGDILIVAHGHILRAFAMRWAGKTLQDGPAFLLEAGGVGTLRYAAPLVLVAVSLKSTRDKLDANDTSQLRTS